VNGRSPRWTAAIAALSLAIGLFGLRWGLPSRARLERVLAPGLDTPESHARLIEAWSKLQESFGPDIMTSTVAWTPPYRGVQRVAPGWTQPPPLLQNSVRAFYIRTAHEDEQSFLIVLSRMRPWRLELNPHLYTYGGGYIYSLGAWLALGAVLHLTTLHTSLAPYMADPASMASLYYFGRLFTLAAFVGCALMLLRIGRRHLDERTGVLAALFFLFSPGAIVQAHTMKNHMLWALLVLWTLDLSLGLLGAAGLGAYAAAGAVSGLAVGTFLAAWPACLFVAAAAVLRVAVLRKRALAELKGLVVAGAASAAAFFAVNPYWILDWRNVRAEMAVLTGWSTFSAAQPLLFLEHAFPLAVTWPLFALIAAGLVWALARARKEPALCLCALAFLAGLAMMMTVGNVISVGQTRYFVGFLAVGQLLAGRAAAELLGSRPSRRPWAVAAVVLVLGQLALAGMAYAYNFHADATPRSTHWKSGAWIEEHVPPGATIGMLRLPQPSNAPYFHYDRYDLRFIESAAYFSALPPAELPAYVAVTSPDYDDRPAMEPNLSRYELAARFDRARLVPWISIDPTSTTADPLIEIYRLKR